MLVRDHRALSKTPHPDLPGIMLQHIQELKVKRVVDLNLRIFEVLPGTENPLHSHIYSHDLFVIKGEGVVRLEERRQKVKEGDLVSIDPNERHSFVNEGDSSFLFLCIDYQIEEG